MDSRASRRGARCDPPRPDCRGGGEALDWPRPDFNLACLELLIGLVYLAAPPGGTDDWLARRPNPQALRAALAPLAPAFHLLGDRERFMQDLAPLEGEAQSTEMLFIDAAGENAAKKNADLMVKRGRFGALDLPTAAMALYTLQAHAPAGGAGHRTSMRGGGPLVTLAQPSRPGLAPLWSLIWANVPEGRALGDLTELPWMRPTVTSEKGQVVHQPEADFSPAEVFFGMPRRVRLVAEGDRITGVIQRPYGTNYGIWQHPLSPYYAMKEGAERLAVHPRPGPQSYRNWMGVSLAQPEGGQTRWRGQAMATYLNRTDDLDATILAGGWAMSNMSPLDFILSEQPLFPFGPDASETWQAAQLVEAADMASRALMRAAKSALMTGEGTPADPLRETFYQATEAAFRAALRRIVAGQGGAALADDWLRQLRKQALAQFDALARPQDYDAIPAAVQPFSARPTMKTLVEARTGLLRTLHGQKIHAALGREKPGKEAG